MLCFAWQVSNAEWRFIKIINLQTIPSGSARVRAHGAPRPDKKLALHLLRAAYALFFFAASRLSISLLNLYGQHTAQVS